MRYYIDITMGDRTKLIKSKHPWRFGSPYVLEKILRQNENTGKYILNLQKEILMLPWLDGN
jgi:hypothetical protein